MQQDFLFYGFLLFPFYHLFTAIMLILNIRWMYPNKWAKLKNMPIEHTISICIPARNESSSIGACLNSILTATKAYPIPIWVLDDNSVDDTAAIVLEIAKNAPQINLLKGEKLPDGWRGKNWACQQLSEHQNTDLMLFLDADVAITDKLLPRINDEFLSNPELSMLSFWPEQQFNDQYQKIVIPWVYRALLTHLPSIYQHKKPIWMPSFFYEKVRPLFAAANGQCICFKRDRYISINGHFSVKNEIVEDISICRVMLEQGYPTQIMSGKGAISCSMYDTDKQMFEGFRKNFLVGFGHNIPLFVLAGFFHWVMFILPIVLFFIPHYHFLAAASLILAIGTDLLLKIHYKWPIWTILLHPLGVLWFSKLALKCVIDYYTNTTADWKDRKL